MTELDRDQLIGLLGRLDGADDRDVLTAGREISRLMKESGATWDMVLAPPRRAPEDAPTDASDMDVEPVSDGAGGTLAPADVEEARGLIAALLAMDGISDSTREDLEGLRGDLDEGRFQESDLRYVRALKARLT